MAENRTTPLPIHDSIDLLLGEVYEIAEAVMTRKEPYSVNVASNTNMYEDTFPILRTHEGEPEEAKIVIYKNEALGTTAVTLTQLEHPQIEISGNYLTPSDGPWRPDMTKISSASIDTSASRSGQDIYQVRGDSGAHWDLIDSKPVPDDHARAIGNFVSKAYSAVIAAELSKEQNNGNK